MTMEPAQHPAPVTYASAGETLTCEAANHPVCDLAVDLVAGVPKDFDAQFANWRNGEPADETRYRCPLCRSRWAAGINFLGVLHFAGGWRLHLTFGTADRMVMIDRLYEQITSGASLEELAGLDSITGELLYPDRAWATRSALLSSIADVKAL